MADENMGGEGMGSGEGSATAAADQMRDSFNETVTGPAMRAGEALRQTGRKVAEGGSNIGMKLIDQAETNANQAFSAMRAAAGAKDMGEIMRIQSEFMRDQSNRAMQQAREVGELIVQFGKNAITPMRGGDGQG